MATIAPFVQLTDPTDDPLVETSFPSDICPDTKSAMALYVQMTQPMCQQNCINDTFTESLSNPAYSNIANFIHNPQGRTFYLLSNYQLIEVTRLSIPSPEVLLQAFSHAINILDGNPINFTPSDPDAQTIWNGVKAKVPSAQLSLSILSLFSKSFLPENIDNTFKQFIPSDKAYANDDGTELPKDEYEHAKSIVMQKRIESLASIFNICDAIFVSNKGLPTIENLSHIYENFKSLDTDLILTPKKLMSKKGGKALNVPTEKPNILNPGKANPSQHTEQQAASSAPSEPPMNTAEIESLKQSLQNVEQIAKHALDASSKAAQLVDTVNQALNDIKTMNPSGTSDKAELLKTVEQLRTAAQAAEQASAAATQAVSQAQEIKDAAKKDAEHVRTDFQSQADAMLHSIEDLFSQIRQSADSAKSSAIDAQAARDKAAEEGDKIREHASTLSEEQIAQMLGSLRQSGASIETDTQIPSEGTEIPSNGDTGIETNAETPTQIPPRVNIPQKVLGEIYNHAASRDQIIAAIRAVEQDITDSTPNAEFLTRFVPGVTQTVIKDILTNRTPSGQYITKTAGRIGEGIPHTNLTGGHTFISGNQTKALGSVEVPAGFTQDNSSVLWNEPVITSMGFPFINFGAPEIQVILKSKDEKQVKQAYAKLKKQMKRIGLTSPIKVLKDFKNARGVTCAINRISVDADELTEAGNAQVNASVYPRISTTLQASIGTVPLTRDFIVELYNVLSPVKGAKVYMDTLGMDEDEYADMINRNGKPPLYIFVPKDRMGFRKGASSFISRIFTSNSKPTLVEAKIGSHHGGFVMPFKTTQVLFTEV